MNGRPFREALLLGIALAAPRIFATEFTSVPVAPASFSHSPVSNVFLGYASGTGHAAICALSGTSGGIKPIVDVQPVSTNVFAGSSVLLSVGASGTPPLQFKWQRAANGAFANLTNGGSVAGVTSSNLIVTTAALADAGSYQVLISNAFGVSTSAVVRLNVLSTSTDVTTPGDEITSLGGPSPDAEPVANAIDNTTSKYLNFGTDSDQVAPFVGPVGLIVTPSIGSTVVIGLRVYTANDAVDRDPVDYRLEGALGVGATSFILIASGVLTLPEARNAAALELDPVGQADQEVLFPNTAGYPSYRLTFTSVKNSTNANSLQIGEIELLGTAGPGTPTAQLSVIQGGAGSLILTSSQPGLLQSTMVLTGAGTVWDDVGPMSGAVTIMPSRTARFYRVSLQPR